MNAHWRRYLRAVTIWIDRRATDCRIALRGLRRSPSATVSAVLVLSIAIAMAATMTTVVRAILLERLPVRDQDHLITLRLESKAGAEVPVWSGAELAQLQRASHTMRAIGAVYHAGVYTYPLLDGRRPVLNNRVMVSGSFFEVLGARPIAGRLLETNDDATVTHDLVHPPMQPLVLSHKAWLEWFGGDTAVVGHHLTNPYGPPNYQIVGIAPAGLDFPIGVDYWLPMGNNMASAPLVARLYPGATAASAREELPSLIERIRADSTKIIAVVRARAFVNEIVGDVRPVLIALSAGAAILVLIGCVNVGNLLLLRASARAHETAIRRAIGAANGDILLLFLSESLLIAALGAAGGFMGARALVRLLPAIAPTRLPQLELVRLSGAPVAATITITTVAVFLFGVLPGLVVARQDVGTPLRGGGRVAGPSRSRVQGRRVLVAAQVALAFVLVAGAGLLTRSMSSLAATQLGFNPDHLSFIAVSFPASRYLDSAQHAFPLGEAALARIRAIHGVTAASPVIIPPFNGASTWRWHFVPEGTRDVGGGGLGLSIPMEVGDSALFTTLGVRLVRGRNFTADDRDGSAPVVIVSESAASELWPGQDPIGKQLRMSEGANLPSGEGDRTVVGVVHDLEYREFGATSPTVFLPWRQAMWQGWLAVRTSPPLAAVLPDIRSAVAALGPDINASQAQSMDELLATPLAVPRLGAFLLSAFGSVALLVAAIGLYAVIATAVRQRTHEIGVRLALGATVPGIRRDIVLDAMRIVAIGALVGACVAVGSAKLAASLLHDVSPIDPLAFVGALVLLAAVSYAAALVPAFHVARIDPTTVLRGE